jgi:hypothetical protein
MEKTEEIVMSIQPAIENSKPWDTLIFGVKRDPKTVRSVESKDQQLILNHISQFNQKVKSDLAVAIYASTLAGDESLHTAQFMAVVDEKNCIQQMTRVDHGASGRFSQNRYENKDFKHRTSKVYAASGQFGKEYMTYLLYDDDVKAKYFCLWARNLAEGGIELLTKESVKSFRLQMEKIPYAQKQKTLNEIYDTYTKESSIKRKGDVTQESLEELMQKIISYRLTSMQTCAIKKIKKVFYEVQKDVKTYGVSAQQLKIIESIFKQDFSDSSEKDILGVIHNIHHAITTIYDKSSTLENAIKDHILLKCYKLLSYMYGSMEFSGVEISPKIFSNIEKLQIKMNMTKKLREHQDYLKDSKIINDQAKIALIDQAICALTEGSTPENHPSVILEKLKPITEPSKKGFFRSSENKSSHKSILSRFLKNELLKYEEVEQLFIEEQESRKNSRRRG